MGSLHSVRLSVFSKKRWFNPAGYIIVFNNWNIYGGGHKNISKVYRWVIDRYFLWNLKDKT